jgi:UDP-N-acetylglucosamine/UDP-N-acetylgalactosamine diphosphorylase
MYSLGEVCRLLGIKAHILRYWEKEIPFISPRKSSAGRRIYTQGDLQILSRLRYLLRTKGYTVKGARQKIWGEICSSNPDIRAKIADIRSDLLSVRSLYQRHSGSEIGVEGLDDLMEKWAGEKLFSAWENRSEGQRKRLLEDLDRLDPALVAELRRELKDRQDSQPALAPIDYVPATDSSTDGEARRLGEEALANGLAAFVTVAGGQGSRLGFKGPKGLFPVTPLRKATLFQLFAEKLLAASGKYRTSIPWYIMTSPQNHDETVVFFREKGYFDLPREDVILFNQGELPSFSPEGELLLAADGGLFKNPDGHGGLILALRNNGLFDDMTSRGVKELFYFQVDNPLVNVPDPTFLGFHLRAGSQVSTKVIGKRNPEEKLGTIGYVNGRPGIIEYSDLDEESMYARDEKGQLLYSHGSIAVHLMNVAYLSRKGLKLPYHLARKRIRCLNYSHGRAEIVEKEGIKLETFIFDTIPHADRVLFYETLREEEFAPLKNKNGDDSIETCLAGQIEKAARYLAACGVEVPRDEEGRSLYRLEISPLFAPDLPTLKERLAGTIPILDGEKLFV